MTGLKQHAVETWQRDLPVVLWSDLVGLDLVDPLVNRRSDKADLLLTDLAALTLACEA